MSSKSKLHLPGGLRRPGRARRLVNPGTGDVFLCCYSDCEYPADANIAVTMHHNDGHTVTYTFHNDRHRDMWIADSKPKV